MDRLSNFFELEVRVVVRIIKHFQDQLLLWFYRVGSRFLVLIPLSLSSVFSWVGGVISFIGAPKKRKIVGDNMLRAHSESDDQISRKSITLRAYISYTKYWIEALTVGNLTRADLESRMSFCGLENVYSALGLGKGAIITSPHLGNWDFGAAWFASKGYPITAVMEELKPREVFEWFAEHRIKFGVTAVPGSSKAFGELSKALSRNEIIALVADRDLMDSGVDVSFFGEVTSVPQGTALLSLRTGAPIIPAAIYILPGGFHFALLCEPIYAKRELSLREDIIRVTELVVASYEKLITADPVQWHLFQRNWPSQDHSTR